MTGQLVGQSWVPLAQAVRGKLKSNSCVETLHSGAIAVVDGLGNLIASVGGVDQMVHLRSTAKPFQLLPFLLNGLAEKIWADGQRIDQADLALMMGSHSGEPMHTERLQRLLIVSDISANFLLCGSHAPYDGKTNRSLIQKQEPPGVLHNNCSGKHLAMLMVSKERGWPLDQYIDVKHSLQKLIMELLLLLSNSSEEQLGIGVDGCSLPTFILPLEHIARAYAELANPSSRVKKANAKLADSLSTLFMAGTTHPEMIAGTKRLDTALMRALPHRLFAKTGAEGVFCLALAPDARYPEGLGIAIKIVDGDASQRVRPQVVIETLRQLELLSRDFDQLHSDLQSFASPTINNWRAKEVASWQTLFRLT